MMPPGEDALVYRKASLSFAEKRVSVPVLYVDQCSVYQGKAAPLRLSRTKGELKNPSIAACGSKAELPEPLLLSVSVFSVSCLLCLSPLLSLEGQSKDPRS